MIAAKAGIMKLGAAHGVGVGTVADRFAGYLRDV